MKAKSAKKGKPATTAKDVEKENSIKQLASKIEQAGFRVRREKLKQGPGWRALSGECRVQEDRFIFVDKKSPLDDQLMFLKACAAKLNISEELPAQDAAETEQVAAAVEGSESVSA